MSKDLQGFERYTPSRLEWLVVMLNSYTHSINPLLGNDYISLSYIIGPEGNTITLNISHFPDEPQENLKNAEFVGKHFATAMAKTYKWDSWLDIQLQFSPINRPQET